MSFLDRFFGPSYDKELKAISPLVTAINNKEESISALSTAELFLTLKLLKLASKQEKA